MSLGLDLGPSFAAATTHERTLDDVLPGTPVSSLDAIQSIVGADGDLELAAARLGTKTSSLLVAVITDPNNYDILAKYFRAHQTIKLFGLVGALTTRMEEKLDELKAADLARTLTALMEVFNRFTEIADTGGNVGNVEENTLKMLPPHLQSHVRLILARRDVDVDVDSTTVAA